VGVSHLVQSTRAGAVFGFALIGFVILANLIKYPAFRLGPWYAAATGTSLLEGYRRQGRWALVLYLLLTLGTMFTVQAAVSVVTAGLAKALLGLETSPVTIAAVLIGACAALLAVGRYRWLDRITKVVVAVLTLSTLLATILALSKVSWSTVSFVPAGAVFTDPAALFFIAALIGWMPSAIDVSVWQSLWTLAREKDSGVVPTADESSVDFHVGYIGTAVLALCFVVLGAAVIHGSGAALADTAGGFAAQVIGLYVETLGGWSRYVIGTAAFAVMFSTTLTVIDGFPRALAVLVARFREPERPSAAFLQTLGATSDVATNDVAPQDGREGNGGEGERGVSWVALAVLGIGSILVLYVFLKSLAAMIDVATTLSFLTAPVLSLLNHRAAFSDDIPPGREAPRWLFVASWAGIAIQTAFALGYVWLRFF